MKPGLDWHKYSMDTVVRLTIKQRLRALFIGQYKISVAFNWKKTGVALLIDDLTVAENYFGTGEDKPDAKQTNTNRSH